MIENKIAAPEGDRQDERYHLRGIRSREQGRVDDYVTVICAPQRYLDALESGSAYQHRVPYEAIAEWFEAGEGRRAAWRHHVMREAIDQGRRGYKMLVNQTTTAFHRDYWEYLQRKHPRLRMRRPTEKGNMSTWIIMQGHDFPPGVKLHHKLDQRTVELGFQGRRLEELLAVKLTWPEDILPVQKGKTASLLISVPNVDMGKGLASQVDVIEVVLAAAYRLMAFANLLATQVPVRPSGDHAVPS
jgi:hypothetical protein